MKIVVATIGSRGDVQPYINLSQGLRDAGHDVTLATNPTLCPLVEQHGIKTAPVGSPVDMGAEGARLLEKSFDNMWIGMIRVMQLGARLVEEAYPDVLAACQTADLVVTSDTGSGVVEAEKLAHAITQALTDTAMRAKAAALGTAIRSGPDGVTQAVQRIEQ